MLEVTLERFEGPLDLLLHLIEDEKLDITEVSLSRVADQYLERLAQFSDEHRLDELADFIVIAAKLLLIKSRALVPLLVPEEEEEIQELERQLKLYRAFVDAAKKIDALYRKQRVAFPRRAPLVPDGGFVPPQSVTTQILRDTFARMLKDIQVSTEKPREIIFPARVSIKDKIQHIVTVLSQRAQFRFRDILETAASKADIVVSFMALLELVKQRSCHVSQNTLFDEIVISRSPASASDPRGSTLIEVIIALMVVAVGLVGALSLATSNVRNQGIGLSRLIAINSAREGIELVRNIRDSNWLSGPAHAWYDGLAGSTTCAVIDDARVAALDFVPCPAGADFFTNQFRLAKSEITTATTISDILLQQGSQASVSGSPTAFYRKLEVRPIYLVAGAETFTGCTDCTIADAIGMRVTSEVSWKQSGQDRLVRLRENLYNWR